MLNEKLQIPVDKNRLERWKVTGVVALSESNLKVQEAHMCYAWSFCVYVT